MYNEVQKKKAAARARKNLDNNYKHVAANVKLDMVAKWTAYAEERGISMRSLIIGSIEHAIEEDFFAKSSENVQEK